MCVNAVHMGLYLRVTPCVYKCVSVVLVFVSMENQSPQLPEYQITGDPWGPTGLVEGVPRQEPGPPLGSPPPHGKSPLWVLGLRAALALAGTKERDRRKRLAKDSGFKSSQAGQVGGTAGHQALTHAPVLPGHSMDGECSRGEGRDGVIGEKPGIGWGWVRLCLHRGGHVGALCHPNHLSAGHPRLQLDFEGSGPSGGTRAATAVTGAAAPALLGERPRLRLIFLRPKLWVNYKGGAGVQGTLNASLVPG